MTPVTRKVRVKVPATSANLGSGFDTVGLALDYHDELEFTLSVDPVNTAAQVMIEGEGEDTLPRDETHLVVSTFRRACQTFGLGRVGFILQAHNNIPQARGMGSSAEAIVAGIAAAAAFAQDDVSTEKARQALPTEIPFKDAVHNVSRVSLLPAAMNPAMLASGSRQNANALLFAATQDRLHQPYRASLMEPSWALIEKMRSHGFASTVSGAGPCVLVLHHGDAHEELERIAAEELASGHWRVLHLAVDTKGVQVERA